MTQQLILHSGGEECTRESLDLVWCPEATRSFQPVSHGTVVDALKEGIDYRLGLKLRSEQYGLNKAGQQMFFALTYDVPGQSTGISFGGRNSVDKTLAAGYVSGARVFVCDNLALHGDSFRVLRKHTTNILADLDILVDDAIDAAKGAYAGMLESWKRLKQIDVSLLRGYEVLGRAWGTGILRPQQASLALECWQEDRHGFGRTYFGLYQACTDGAKRGAPIERIDTLTGIDKFFETESQDLAVRQGLRPLSVAGELLLADEQARAARTDLQGLEID